MQKVAPVVISKQPESVRTTSLNGPLQNRKTLTVILCAVVVLGLAYLFRSAVIVAVVNGQPVYRWSVIERLEKQGGQQVLDSLVTEALVQQEIRRVGAQVTQEEVDAEMMAIEERMAGQGITLDQALEQEGLTREELIRDIRLRRGAEKAAAQEATVSEEEIDAYIADNAEFLPADAPEEELRAMVREQLRSMKVSDTLNQWVQDLRTNAKIVQFKQYAPTPLSF